MKAKIFVVLAGIALVSTGCISTVSGTHTAAVPLTNDRVENRYARTLDEVYRAAVQIMQNDGVVITEYIPHDTPYAARALYGKVNQNKVWIRVDASDPRITAITVEARTRYGGADLDLAHELATEIALQLARGTGS